MKYHYYICQTSNSLKGLLLLILFVSLFVPVHADSFNKYVGQSFVLPIPRCPISSGFVNSWSYSCSSTNINITNRGSSDPSEAVITRYFDGSLTIECFFQYIYYVNNIPRSGTSREYHIVTCNSNNISISAPRSTLNVGETMQMTYRFSTTTFGTTPQITWRSNSSAIAINSVSGYVEARSPGTATITATSNLSGNVAEYTVYVQKINPTRVEITPNPATVYCDATQKMYATVYPSGASQSVTWSMYSGNSTTATIDYLGYVTGNNPGEIIVKATAENGVYALRTVTVKEPSFIKESSSPSNNSTRQSVFVSPTVYFSHTLYKGSNFEKINLKSSSGENISGVAKMSGRSIVFSPNVPLAANTQYILTIPANSVKNKWGTSYSSAATVTFTTGDLEKLTLSTSLSSKFIDKGTSVTLSTNKSSASIYYTLDGGTPTEKSNKYTGPIVLNADAKLRAIAIGAGYENSDILSQDYYITNVKIARTIPNATTRLYEYKDLNPCLTFSNLIVSSDNIGDVVLKKDGKELVDGEVVVTDSSIYFIPNRPLDEECVYTMTVPQNAINTIQGENNKLTLFTFRTGDYALDIAVGAELTMALKVGGRLQTWGNVYKSGNVSDGSYEMELLSTPAIFVKTDVQKASSGYMHHAIIKTDGSLWMWGRQYCGEFGNGSTQGSADPIKIMTDVADVSCGGQTTAIVMKDGSLWMCGRNDFGQLGDGSYMTRTKPVKVMDDVVSVVAGWCTTYAIKNDGTLWAWGRNDQHQMGNGDTGMSPVPVKVMDDVASVSSCVTEGKYVSAIKKDGTLWIWGKNMPSPVQIMSNAASVAVGVDYLEIIKTNGELWSLGGNSIGQMTAGNMEAVNGVAKIMDDVKKVVSDGYNSTIFKKDKSVWSWGYQSSQDEPLSDPKQIIEGRVASKLSGITGRRKSYVMSIGDKFVIEVYPSPAMAEYANLKWESKNKNIVDVYDRGVIEAMSLGRTEVQATIIGLDNTEYSMSFTVDVIDDTNSDHLNYFTSDGSENVLYDFDEWVNILSEAPNAVAVATDDILDWAKQHKNVIVEDRPSSYLSPEFILSDLSFGYSSNAITAAKTGFYTPVSFKVTKGTYKRQAYAGYNTLCLPFSFKASELSSSAKVFTFDSYDADKTKVVFKFVSGTIDAGTPCIVKEKTNVVWNVNLAGKTIEAAQPSEESHMRGTYVTTDLYQGKGYSPRSSDNKFAPLTQYLHPFRACFSVSDLNDAGARGSLSAVFLDEDGATVIDEINAAGGTADDSKTIYTLSGQRINEVKRSGIYIVNGEKQYIEVK